MAQEPSPWLADALGHEVELLVDLLELTWSYIPVPGITAFHMRSPKPVNYD